MNTPVIRRLPIGLETGVPRQRGAGDPFRTACFGALSVRFPVGEQFFFDAVRNAHKALSPEALARFYDAA